jgi:hypothetical protein
VASFSFACVLAFPPLAVILAMRSIAGRRLPPTEGSPAPDRPHVCHPEGVVCAKDLLLALRPCPRLCLPPLSVILSETFGVERRIPGTRLPSSPCVLAFPPLSVILSARHADLWLRPREATHSVAEGSAVAPHQPIVPGALPSPLPSALICHPEREVCCRAKDPRHLSRIFPLCPCLSAPIRHPERTT